ncbi:MAG TPA: cysteine synthase family protein [Bryobacteraceae bacterium]|nr:cysteine synthase family protein [Bryobacteraceae bacterium]
MASTALFRGARVLDQIGRTPLLHLARISARWRDVDLYAKAEFLNPGGSVKDRPALRMIEEGERTGLLRRGQTILDATSGNTGIAYAMIGAAKGYPAKICIPQNASPERKRTLAAYGVEMVLTDPTAGSDGAILRCRDIYRADPSRYFYPDQYNNEANWRAHYEGTGPEILEQTARGVTHFVAALGTSGTFTGVTRRLKAEVAPVECIAVQPSSGFHGIEGTKNMEAATLRPGIYDPSLADRTIFVETEGAQAMTRRLAREEGLLVGISSGANVLAAAQVAAELAAEGRAGVIVTVLCDGGEKYLSESFWNDPD